MGRDGMRRVEVDWLLSPDDENVDTIGLFKIFEKNNNNITGAY